jgi:hypothetical protein
LTKEPLPSALSSHTGWFKSSYSNASGSCVEARLTSSSALVRDTKDRRMDPSVITFSTTAWSAFVDILTSGDA